MKKIRPEVDAPSTPEIQSVRSKRTDEVCIINKYAQDYICT